MPILQKETTRDRGNQVRKHVPDYILELCFIFFQRLLIIFHITVSLLGDVAVRGAEVHKLAQLGFSTRDSATFHYIIGR